MLILNANEPLSGVAGTTTVITYTIYGLELSTATGVEAYKRLAQGTLSSSAGTLYAAPASTSTLIKEIRLANTTGSAVSGIIFYQVGTIASNAINGTLTIPANGSAVIASDGIHIYDATGAALSAYSSAAMAANTIKGNNTGSTAIPVDLTQAQFTAMLNPATVSFQGAMTPSQVGTLNGIWVDVTQQGTNSVLVSNSAAVNSTNIAAIMTAANNGSTLYFPPGTYQFASALSPGAKTFLFKGARGGGGTGQQVSILQTTSALADIVTLTDGHWYTEFEDLGFTTSVNKTAGNCITTGTNTGGGNIGINIRRCSFFGQSSGTLIWNGVVYAGTSSGNITIIEQCNFNNFANIGIQLLGNTTTNSPASSANIIISAITMNGTTGASTSTATGIDIFQCGSALIINCDLVNCQQNLLINPTVASTAGNNASSGVFSVLCVNVFFDQAYCAANGGSVLMTGGGFIQRCKFTSCWFTMASNSAGSAAAVMINPSSNSTISGLDFTVCDFYNTTALTNNIGLQFTGADLSVSQSHFAGHTSEAINIAPFAGSVTEINITDNIIGPSGGYGANTLGINMFSGVYKSVFITNNNMLGNTNAYSQTGALTYAAVNSCNYTGNLGFLSPTYLTTAFALASASATSVTGMVTTLPIGTYSLAVQCLVFPSGTVSAGTSTCSWAVTGTMTGQLYHYWSNLGATGVGSTTLTTPSTASTTHGTAASVLQYIAQFQVVVTAAGTLQLQALNSIAADGITFAVGCSITPTKVA